MDRLAKFRWAERLYQVDVAVGPFIMLAALVTLFTGLLGNAGVSGWLLLLAAVALLLLIVYHFSPSRRINALIYRATLLRRGGTTKGMAALSAGEQIRAVKTELYSLRPSFVLSLAAASCFAVYGLMLATIDRHLLIFGWLGGSLLAQTDSLWWGILWLAVAATFALVPYNIFNRLRNTITSTRRRQVSRLLGYDGQVAQRKR